MTKRGSAVTYRPQKNVVTITFMLQKTHFFDFKPNLRLIFEMRTHFRTLYDKGCNTTDKRERMSLLKIRALTLKIQKKRPDMTSGLLHVDKLL